MKTEEPLATFSTRLMAWYRKHHRPLPWRKSRDPYAIWISEVMLQQTQVKTVLPYYGHFLTTLPTVKDLAESDMETVLKLWEGLGYYGRARNLHRAAGMVMEHHQGKVPDDWKTFKTLPGVGDYIASAVQSIAFDHPYAVVDGNVKRVLARMHAMDQAVNDPRFHREFKHKADQLLDTSAAAIFNQAFMELGALVCTPRNPGCTSAPCPVCTSCQAFCQGSTDRYPVKKQKKTVPLYHIAAGVVRKEGRLLITRRKSQGLLGGLWEFPGGKVKPRETAAAACVREIAEETGLVVSAGSFLTRVKHAYSHFRIEMDVFLCDWGSGTVDLNGPVDFRWISPLEIDDYPFPGANLKFIPLLQQALLADSH